MMTNQPMQHTTDEILAALKALAAKTSARKAASALGVDHAVVTRLLSDTYAANPEKMLRRLEPRLFPPKPTRPAPKLRHTPARDPNAPDWMRVLAEEVANDGNRGVAARIAQDRCRISDAAISSVMSGTYAGSLPNIERIVRGALMGERHACRIVESIPAHYCIDMQRTYLRGSPVHSPQHRQVQSSCPGCPRYLHAGKKGGAK